jgi:hypothetical protein
MKVTPQVREAFNEMIDNWNGMGRSDMDGAGEAADRFQNSFYHFVDELREWLGEQEKKPQSLDQALEIPAIRELADELPGPLLLNFETELELIVEGLQREEEEKYD